VWQRAASRERALRHTFGWLEIAGGAVLGGLSTALLVTQARQGLVYGSDTGLDTYFLTSAGMFLGIGVYEIATEGAVESSLHAYQRASSSSAWGGATDIGPRVSLAPGGGVLGVGGRF
jgi:hypothetical protein